MATRLVIVGAGGFGREVLDVLEAINAVADQFEVLGFLDDDPTPGPALTRRAVAIVGPVSHLAAVDADYVIGIGAPDARARIDQLGVDAGRASPVLVHPMATVGVDNRIGPGAVLTAGARITTNVTAGRHLHLNLNATIGHDCVIGDHVTIYPGANISGNVTLGDRVRLGTGSAVIEGITIGDDVTVGAGAVVIDDLPSGVTAVGVPARPVG